ncbi:MAG: chloride channel protein [Bacteriovoracaceae bacterium]|nr:chloride channel protein [Bacteriovoracaceae bacterium]
MKSSNNWQIKLLRKVHRINIDPDTLFYGLTLIVGIGSALIAIFIFEAIEFLSSYFHTMERPTLASFLAGGVLIFISGFITTRISPDSSGSGIPQTKIALVAHHGKITLKDWISKLTASILALSSGVSLGREGPTVAVTSGFGSSVGRLFRLSKTSVRSLVAVGSAGGIAAAFNTPIAAVTFTLEEVIGNLNAKSLGPIVISSVAAAVTAKIFYGGETMFSGVKYIFEDPNELLFYLALGLLAGSLGPTWVKFMLYLRKSSLSFFKGHKLSIIMCAFLLTYMCAWFFPYTLGSGHHLIHDALLSKFTEWDFIAKLFLVKFLFSSICYSAGISGGLFMPTLFLGAMIGSLTGLLAQFVYPGVNPAGAFALVGMGAFFAAVIRAPFTSILIIFELTQDYKIILPLMIANITAFILSKRLMKGSVYEQISEQDGVHLPNKDDFETLEKMTVEEAMIKDIKTLDATMTVKEAMAQVNHSEISGYPVMKGRDLFGVLSTNQIGQACVEYKGQCLLSDVCTKELIVIYPDQSLMVAFHLLNTHKVSRLLVTSRINDKRLLGIITAEDIVNCFGFHIQEESKADVIDRHIQKMESSG